MITKGRTQKNIIFHGNSLFNLTSGSLVSNGRYCENKLYQNIYASKSKYSAVFLSVNGNPTATKIADWATQTLPIIRPNDIVILWEIQNDVSAGGLTGQQAYDNLVTFAGLVHGVGAKIVVGSATARNHTSDTDQFTRNSACNTLLRADSSFCDLFVDIGAQANFTTQAEAANTTYYQTDKLHHTTAGSDLIASYFSTQMINSGLL
jgi:hypothetical protein